MRKLTTIAAILVLLTILAVPLASAQTLTDGLVNNPPKAEKAEGDAANITRPNPAWTKATGPETAPPEEPSGPELSEEELEEDQEAALA